MLMTMYVKAGAEWAAKEDIKMFREGSSFWYKQLCSFYEERGVFQVDSFCMPGLYF